MPRAPRTDKSATEIARTIERNYRKNKKRLEDALKELTPGCVAYVRCVEAMSKLDANYLAQRAERGIDVQDVGLAARPTGFHFVAFVGTDGAVSTKEIPAELIEQVLSQRVTQHRQRMQKIVNDPERRKAIKELEQEFPDVAPRRTSTEDEADDQ